MGIVWTEKGSRLLSFMGLLGRQWGLSLGGPVVTLVLVLAPLTRQDALTWITGFIAALLCLGVAAFKVWERAAFATTEAPTRGSQLVNVGIAMGVLAVGSFVVGIGHHVQDRAPYVGLEMQCSIGAASRQADDDYAYSDMTSPPFVRYTGGSVAIGYRDGSYYTCVVTNYGPTPVHQVTLRFAWQKIPPNFVSHGSEADYLYAPVILPVVGPSGSTRTVRFLNTLPIDLALAPTPDCHVDVGEQADRPCHLPSMYSKQNHTSSWLLQDMAELVPSPHGHFKRLLW